MRESLSSEREDVAFESCTTSLWNTELGVAELDMVNIGSQLSLKKYKIIKLKVKITSGIVCMTSPIK